MIYGVLWKFFLDNMTNIRSGQVQILEGWKNPEKRPISRKNQKKGVSFWKTPENFRPEFI
jgi:hypothetical protein